MYDPPTLALRFKSDILTWTEYDGAVTEEWHNMEPGKYCGFVILIEMTSGEIIALMNNGIIRHARVGGTAAICTVRDIKEVSVWSPTKTARENFPTDMTAKLGVPAKAVADNLAVAEGADIVSLCTDSRKLVYTKEMLEAQKPGGLFIRCRIDEIDGPVYDAFDKIIGMSKESYDDLSIGSEQERARWPSGKAYLRRYGTNDWPILASVINGDVAGSENDSETIFFDNNSAGLQFAAVGRVIYDGAGLFGPFCGQGRYVWRRSSAVRRSLAQPWDNLVGGPILYGIRQVSCRKTPANGVSASSISYRLRGTQCNRVLLNDGY